MRQNLFMGRVESDTEIETSSEESEELAIKCQYGRQWEIIKFLSECTYGSLGFISPPKAVQALTQNWYWGWFAGIATGAGMTAAWFSTNKEIEKFSTVTIP